MSKRKLFVSGILTVLLSISCVFAQTNENKPNVSYKNTNAAGVNLNVVEIPNSTSCNFDVVKANNAIVGSEPFQSIIKRTNPVVAVNGNFFDAYKTLVPYGNIVNNGKVIQGIGNDGAFIRTKSGKSLVSETTVTHKLETNGKSLAAWYTNNGLNDNTAICVFNSYYGKSVKVGQGRYAVIKDDKIVDYGKLGGVVNIPENGYVVYFANKSIDLGYLDGVMKVGNPIKKSLVFNEEPRLANEEVDALVAAGPVLVKDGKNVSAKTSAKYESKIKNQVGQRSAIGVKADGTVVIATGKANTNKLANAMIELGCKEATNLDGGASSALYVNGKVVTSPGRNLNTVLVVK